MIKYSKTYLAVVVAAILIFLFAFFQGKARGKAKGYTRAPVDPDAVTPGFDPFAMAQKVANNFQGWQFWSAGRREVVNDLWRLTDAELAMTYNAYQEDFSQGETMTQVIRNDWVGGNEVNRVINRLTQMGLP